MDSFITPKEAAKLLAVPISWIYGKNHRKEFPPDVAIKVGAYLRFDREALLSWLKKGGARKMNFNG